MTKIDLKTYPFLCQLSGKTLEGGTYVHRTIDFLAGYGLHAVANLSPLRGQIPGRFQNKKVFLPRSIPLYGLRPAHLQRQSSRYRSMPSLSKQKALPYGYSWQCIQVNTGRSQRKKGLAHLCRTGSISYSHSQNPLQHRNVSRRIRGNCLRARLNNHRSLPLRVSLGILSQNQKWNQASYIAGLKRKHSNIYPYFRCQAPRCKRSRYHALGSRSLLHYGSRLSGLQATLSVQPNNIILCNSRKIQHQIQKTLFTPRGQSHRPDLRSNNCLNWHQKQKRISRQTSTHQIQRSRDVENPCVLTNNFTLPPLVIAKLYKSRWQVELFFKWIKQHLKIKKFFGTSVNAVKSQIWIAVSVYVLVAILKKRLHLQESLYTILQILSVTIFEKESIYQLITEKDCMTEECVVNKQLKLFY